MDRNKQIETEEKVKLWLDEILDAAIEGDFKAVRKIAKRIHKLALETSMLSLN